MHSHQSKSDLFKGRHFEQEIIILCVRGYLRYKLSYRNLVEMNENGACQSSHDYPLLDSAVACTGVRQTLELLHAASWYLLASGQYLCS